MKKKNKGEGLLSSVVNVFELPPEVILNTPLVSITGREYLTIENYNSIAEYSEGLVKVLTKDGFIKISGNNIHIQEINKDEIILKGKFTKIEYEL